jgi:hypothetical protein
MENYKVGDFGKAVFTPKNNITYKTHRYGRITAIESKVLEFTDNDDNKYIVFKNKFQFEPEDFKPKNII